MILRSVPRTLETDERHIIIAKIILNENFISKCIDPIFTCIVTMSY